MPRKKNTSFAGVRLSDIDRGDLTYRRVIENVKGDAAFMFDKLTGSNGEAGIISHVGSPQGCPLAIPLCNQYVGRSISVTNSTGTKNGGEGETNILAVPLFIPTGNLSNIVIEVFMSLATRNRDALQMRAILTSTVLAEQDTEAFQFDDFALGVTRARCMIDASAAGLHLLFVRLTTDMEPPPGDSSTRDIPIGTIHSWSIRYDDTITQPAVPARLASSPYSVWTPSATEGLGYRNADTTMFANNAAYHAWHTVGADRDLNALLEFSTGWPAGWPGSANASYTHVDHDSGGSPDSTDPARSRFHAGTRSLYSAEPEFDFPIFTEALGAFKTDGGLVVDLATPPTAPSRGMLDWHAPYITATTQQIIRRTLVVWPDFGTASSRLKFAVLLGSDAAADVNDFTVTINKTAGRTTLSNPFGAGTIGACDGTNIYWLATATAATFSPDTQDTVDLELEKTTDAFQAANQAVVLGWTAYFDP